MVRFIPYCKIKGIINLFTCDYFKTTDHVILLITKMEGERHKHYYEVEGLWRWVLSQTFKNETATTPDTRVPLTPSQYNRILKAYELVPSESKQFCNVNAYRELLLKQREEMVQNEHEELVRNAQREAYAAGLVVRRLLAPWYGPFALNHTDLFNHHDHQ